MQKNNDKTTWESYCHDELIVIAPILNRHGYVLDEMQPHLQGERYLMNAITTTSGKKLILLGKDPSEKRVVIKVSREKHGIDEIKHEKMCRTILTKIDFARDVFNTPREVAYIEEGGYVIRIQEFIEQTCAFLERPLRDQFSFALSAFKGQEGAHATTYKHHAFIANVFGVRTGDTYLNSFAKFKTNIALTFPHEMNITTTLNTAFEILTAGEKTTDQYCGFLTHTDFVPHNIRIMNDTIYLLDHSSITFGNKYEGWARFINFMTLYNPPLQHALEQYVRDNRTKEESDSLRLMRIYRLGEIIWYYVRTLEKSSDSLFELNTTRIYFWNTVLSLVLKREEVSQSIIDAYKAKRDSLRSDEEKERQINLH